ncbi:MAG: malto-oligosyltrehalose trehalohydrolase, partial [Frankiales bacterium]|nr:malto-oligosyltrehalose trehalohydrolase [Frankiales bacterium]
FVVFDQNHDQVGNRALGDRIDLSPGLARVGAALYLLSPYTPMVFMGEEYRAQTPWRFFSNHEGDIADAVRQGRKEEFARHGWNADDIPDPQDPATFLQSKLDWKLDEDQLAFYRSLITLRRSRADLSDGRREQVSLEWNDEARWLVMRRGQVALACNLSAERQTLLLPGAPVHVLLASSPGWVYGDGHVETDGESVVVLELAGQA